MVCSKPLSLWCWFGMFFCFAFWAPSEDGVSFLPNVLESRNIRPRKPKQPGCYCVREGGSDRLWRPCSRGKQWPAGVRMGGGVASKAMCRVFYSLRGIARSGSELTVLGPPFLDRQVYRNVFLSATIRDDGNGHLPRDTRRLHECLEGRWGEDMWSQWTFM